MLVRWRVLGTAIAPLALVAACSGSDAGTAPPPQPSRFSLVAFNDCEQVLSGLRTATERQIGPYGLPGLGGTDTLAAGLGARAQAAPGPSAGAALPKPPEHSRTNAHEAGADEPDLVKTDGRRIVTMARGRLHVIDPATRKVVHRLDLPTAAGGHPLLPVESDASKLLLSGDRALVLTPRPRIRHALSMPGVGGPAGKPVMSSDQTTLTLVDLAGTPKVIGSLETSAHYVDARQTGSLARVVVRSVPEIDFPDPPRSRRDEPEVLERNKRIVRSAPLDAWQPAFQVRGRDGQARTYKTPCANISHPRDDAGSNLLSVLTLDLAKDLGDPAPVSIAAEGQEVYGNGNTLYVTSSAYPPYNRRLQRPEPASTRIHKFRTEGAQRPRYVASGSVPGHLLDQYALSEHDGRLRVAITTTRFETASPESRPSRRSESTVHVLAERDGRLAEVGRIGGLGKGESIFSVRFIGPTAYVVTFRRIDPLYVVDLKDPARPRVTGELKMTGYSAYLHPTGNGRLLGVGQEADTQGRTQGVQVSLFDVTAAPRRISEYHLPGSYSGAEAVPHAFLYWPQNGLTVLPIVSTDTPKENRREALVLKVSRDRVQRVGTVEHPDRGDASGGTIQRSVIVGDTLWTISMSGARATGTATLDDRGWLPF